jgi:predicted RNA-binding protein with PIN domain
MSGKNLLEKLLQPTKKFSCIAIMVIFKMGLIVLLYYSYYYHHYQYHFYNHGETADNFVFEIINTIGANVY